MREHVEIEIGRDALFVVIGTLQDTGILLEIDTDQQTAVTAHQSPDLPE